MKGLSNFFNSKQNYLQQIPSMVVYLAKIDDIPQHKPQMETVMPTTLAPELEGLSNFDIVMICEGVEEPKSEEQYFACWQHLVNTGQAWSLQGWFGRTALQLIEAGHITR